MKVFYGLYMNTINIPQQKSVRCTATRHVTVRLTLANRTVYPALCTHRYAVRLILFTQKDLEDPHILTPVPVAARSEAWVCGRSPAEIVGSNPTGGKDVCLFWVLCVVR